MTIEQDLQQHYSLGTLAEAVDRSLRSLGKDPAHITQKDLEPIDELHIGGAAATLRFLSSCAFPRGASILDVGSGLGGPARINAVTNGVRVLGIDLTPELVAVASELSRRVGLGDVTEFQAGSALDMPFEAGRFDGATMIHVGMNITDKARLFREVRRVLKAGATFGIYDVMRISDGPLSYPVPWSAGAATSFVESPGHYAEALRAAGFEVEAELDRSSEALAFFESQLALVAAGNAPRLYHRGSGFKAKSENLLAMLRRGLLAPREIIARAA